MATYKLMGDFETTTLEKDCRVWASCLVDIDSNEVVQLTNNIDDTINFFKVNSKSNKLEVYYHNLKFDGEFILSYLLSNGFTYDDTLSDKNTYRTLITDTGAFYQLEIKFFKGKNAKVVVIRDSLKILPLPVKKLAESFGLDILKGEIDYKAFRKKGHILTKEETDYIINDCKIVAECLKQTFESGLNKMTIASNAMNSYKEMIGKKMFNIYYPTLSIEDDSYIRKSYKGGFTYVNPKYQNKDINKNGVTYDVNSLYPSVMKNALLPFGMPIYFKGEYQPTEYYPLYIQHIKCKFKLKKGFIPTIQIKGNSRFANRETEYLSDSGVERVDLYVTSVDLEIIKRHYNLSRVEYVDGYMFKGRVGLFKEYIEYWGKVKEENDDNPGLRQIAKLMLNSLYGKFAVNPINDLKVPCLRDNVTSLISKKDVVDKEIDLDGVIKPVEDREVCYTAMASFITSYARKVTITAFQNNVEFCCYADTDSIHLIGDSAKDIDIDNKIMGYWKKECNWTYAKFIRAKTYIEEIGGELDVKCAGMPKNTKKAITKENFKIGFTTEGLALEYQKLQPKRVVGGVVLKEVPYSIK